MLDRKIYFIREHVAMMKWSDTCDILDPESQKQLGVAREKPSTFVHVLRLVLSKRFLPTKVHVYEGEDPQDETRPLFSIERGFSFLRPKVDVRDGSGHVVGWFKSKAFSLGGAFRVFDSLGNEVALVKGDWTGWNFRFLDRSENEMGTITKKWAGIGKELFTSADNYVIALTQGATPEKAMLLLAAGLAVDTVYKER